MRIGAVFDAGGITIAVLGTPIDKIYPRSNYGLAQRILERGAIISEYPVGTETRARHFLERNRLVSGLADVVVTRTMSAGCNSLLRNAQPYVGFDDFISHALKMRPKARRRQQLAPDERVVIEQIKSGVISGEEIAKNLNLDNTEFCQVITLLEMKNVVRALGCNQWALV